MRLSVVISDRMRFDGDPRGGYKGKREIIQISEYLDIISSATAPAKSYYLAQKSIPDIFPILVHDIEIPDYFKKKLLAAVNLWIGPKGNTTPLHYDTSQNLLSQVRGRKRLVLYPPEQFSRLYPHSVYSKIPHMSQVNIDSPDLQKFPKFHKAQSVECILEEGEMLFIPAGWWHQVYSLDLAISVNFWWRTYLRHYPSFILMRSIYGRIFRRMKIAIGSSH
jgi:cupin-like protein